MNNGQISSIVLWALGVASTAFLGYAGWTATAVNSVRAEIGKVQEVRAQDIQRITVVETDTKTVKEDVKEIKADVKSILQKLK